MNGYTHNYTVFQYVKIHRDFPYKLRVRESFYEEDPPTFGERLSNVYLWCKDSFAPEYNYDDAHYEIFKARWLFYDGDYLFKRQTDAALFKLWWM